MERLVVSFTVNRESRQVTVEPRVTLADALREHLGLTGTHLGCEHGVCGACAILVDGRPVRSCLMLTVQAEGADLLTVEGLAHPDGTLHPLQQAFSDCHGLQCGFCTPGMLMTAVHLLATNPSPTRDEVRVELSGNLCRCTGYRSITDSVLAAAETLLAAEAAER
ncbi:MAG: (2Fe-2S)-binding protein [Actinomycetota bacterium]|nr:(2Fe-2S)-binding protein [Actinomycetota bacterium]